MVNSGLCSNHSLGRAAVAVSVGEFVVFGAFSTNSPAVCACAASGADHQAMSTETVIRTAVNANDCHRKIVSVKGITPVIASSGLGMLAGFACNWAADDERPIAHEAPRPRYAAAPAAR